MTEDPRSTRWLFSSPSGLSLISRVWRLGNCDAIFAFIPVWVSINKPQKCGGKNVTSWCAFSVQVVHKHKHFIALVNKMRSLGDNGCGLIIFSTSRNEGESYVILSYVLTLRCAWKWQKDMENVVDYLLCSLLLLISELYYCWFNYVFIFLWLLSCPAGQFRFGARWDLAKQGDYLFIQQILCTSLCSTHRWQEVHETGKIPKVPLLMGFIF